MFLISNLESIKVLRGEKLMLNYQVSIVVTTVLISTYINPTLYVQSTMCTDDSALRADMNCCVLLERQRHWLRIQLGKRYTQTLQPASFISHFVSSDIKCNEWYYDWLSGPLDNNKTSVINIFHLHQESEWDKKIKINLVRLHRNVNAEQMLRSSQWQ